MELVRIYDTTLRDGAQSPGISLTPGQRLEIAQQLVRLGVDIIEVGRPTADDAEFAAVEMVAAKLKGVTVSAAAPLPTIDRSWEAIRHAQHPRLHTAIESSKQSMKRNGETEAELKRRAAERVSYITSFCDDLQFSPQDATRSDPDFVVELAQIAVDNGAKTINLPDTLGCAVPDEFAKLVAYVRENVRGEFVISTHCHDDLGLAVANTLAGVQAGARQVECTINGLGERAGNAPLEEVVMTLRARGDFYRDVSTSVVTTELSRTSALVSAITDYPVQYNKAIVGRNAFQHSHPSHREGMSQDRDSFQFIDAELVGAAPGEADPG